MPTLDEVLKIAGAAEGSYFKDVDLRYTLSEANPKSGLSFGIFQFDTSTNTEAKKILDFMINGDPSCNSCEPAKRKLLQKKAQIQNPKKVLSREEWNWLQERLSSIAVQQRINAATNEYAERLRELINKIISAGRSHWERMAKDRVLPMPILTEGTREHLHLFAYLMASYNRYPANREVFIKWLTGEKAITANGPAGGWQLEAPPTLSDMHAFMKSLRIWDGTQGKYEHLRSRLDPVLQTIVG